MNHTQKNIPPLLHKSFILDFPARLALNLALPNPFSFQTWQDIKHYMIKPKQPILSSKSNQLQSNNLSTETVDKQHISNKKILGSKQIRRQPIMQKQTKSMYKSILILKKLYLEQFKIDKKEGSYSNYHPCFSEITNLEYLLISIKKITITFFRFKLYRIFMNIQTLFNRDTKIYKYCECLEIQLIKNRTQLEPVKLGQFLYQGENEQQRTQMRLRSLQRLQLKKIKNILKGLCEKSEAEKDNHVRKVKKTRRIVQIVNYT